MPSKKPRWTVAEMDAHEQARALLNALISAYSARIGAAPTPEAARELRAERAPLLAERDSLTADDRARIEEILKEVPRQLAAVRGTGGPGE
ncbi:hypothetical protein AB0G74_30620 [Streptomyces sp. NPDC020875]|uniref:hypothetical protein n=1 Tax=Streptomyces sp. NPDC020875 TaxID=3154898 RepID=UPI0033C3C0CC